VLYASTRSCAAGVLDYALAFANRSAGLRRTNCETIVLTGLMFGMAPAILAARQDPNDALRRGGRHETSSNADHLALLGRHSVLNVAPGLLHNAVEKGIVVPGIVMEQD